MAQVRSPNYPAVSLPEAITKIDAVFRKEHKHPSPREVLAQAIGYGSLNGASAVMISALHKYGLLEPVGNKGNYKVSEDAVDILLHRPGDSERVTAIQRTAFMPQLFSELHNHYGDSLPSEQNLRTYLLKRDFNPKTVSGVIRAYRDTIEFVNAETRGSYAESINEVQETPMQTQTVRQAPIMQDGRSIPITPPAKEKELGDSVVSFKLTEECGALVEFKGQVTQEAIEKLVAYLNLSKDAYPTRASLEHRASYAALNDVNE